MAVISLYMYVVINEKSTIHFFNLSCSFSFEYNRYMMEDDQLQLLSSFFSSPFIEFQPLSTNRKQRALLNQAWQFK